MWAEGLEPDEEGSRAMGSPERGAASGLSRREGELIAAGCAVALLVIMLALSWYGTVGRPHGVERSGISSAAGAWRELGALRWLMLLSILVAIGAPLLHLTQRSHGAQTDTGPALTATAVPTALLLAYRVLIDPPAAGSVVDTKLGAHLGLLAAIGIALGGYHQLRQERLEEAEAPPRHRPTEGLPSDAGRGRVFPRARTGRSTRF